GRPEAEPREEKTPAAAAVNYQAPEDEPPVVKSVVTVETPATAGPEETPAPAEGTPVSPEGRKPIADSREAMLELWDLEVRAAKRRLEPEGALTGATRELQAGLGLFLQVCHEHGVKVGPWRLQHVVPEWTFGEHPTYGALAIAHWVCKDGQPWKVGIGLF